MKKWILVLLLCCGCASHKAKIVITRVNGEPSISFEFEEKGRLKDASGKHGSDCPAG